MASTNLQALVRRQRQQARLLGMASMLLAVLVIVYSLIQAL